MFFQWVMCSAIFAVGLMVHAYRGWPTFQPMAMLGGALWTTGNVMCVPTIQMIGLGLGMLIWGSANMLMGWAQGRFGFFGLKEDVLIPGKEWLNAFGIGLMLIALTMFMFIKPEEKKEKDEDGKGKYYANDDSFEKDGMERLWDNTCDDNLVNESTESRPIKTEENGAFYDKLNPFSRRILGMVFAVVQGLFYGLSFTPPTYVSEHGIPNNCGPHGPVGCGDTEMLDYVFPHYTGIFIASTFYFLSYCAIMKNQPKVYPQVILPGYISGLMWAVANTAWFIANPILGFAVAFPLITALPGLVGALWGVFAFQEIRGKRNFTFLSLAFCLTASAGACISLSKQT